MRSSITYSLDFEPRRGPRSAMPLASAHYLDVERVPRIARLLALAIRMERLVRERAVRDYAAVARLGWVTRARMTQIMKLLHLAPDIQEQILFLPPVAGLNERNLRPISDLIDWDEQRRQFQELRGAIGDRATNSGRQAARSQNLDHTLAPQ